MYLDPSIEKIKTNWKSVLNQFDFSLPPHLLGNNHFVLCNKKLEDWEKSPIN
jgi:hypothetical protein